MLFYLLTSSGSAFEIFVFILAYALAVLLALSLHEFSHAFVAHKCGDPTPKSTGRLSLNPFRHLDPWGTVSFLFVGFGWAKPVGVNPLKFRNYKRDMFLVSAAGITTNLLLSFIFSLFAYLMTGPATINLFYNFVYSFFYLFSLVNISLAVFNLLPIFPLDGFNCIAAFLKYDNKFVNFMRKYGSLILLFLIISGLFDFAYSFIVNGIFNGFFALWGLI